MEERHFLALCFESSQQTNSNLFPKMEGNIVQLDWCTIFRACYFDKYQSQFWAEHMALLPWQVFFNFLFIYSAEWTCITFIFFPKSLSFILELLKWTVSFTLFVYFGCSRFEGLKGFYKGLGASLSRVVPATMITFLVYENVSRYFLSLRISNRNSNSLWGILLF